MKLEEVTTRVANVQRLAWDDFEAAHAAEDDLWEDVLTAIANGEAYQLSELAEEALKTKRIVFKRPCA